MSAYDQWTLTANRRGAMLTTTAPHWAGGFGSPFRKGAAAMRRQAHGFFNARTIMVGGAWGGREACRSLFPVYQPDTTPAALIPLTLDGGFNRYRSKIMSTPNTENTPKTALYRLYDASDRLLYVGISVSAIARFKDHKHQSSGWAFDSARIEIKWYASRHEALQAERQAIITEHPQFNIDHSQLNIRKPNGGGQNQPLIRVFDGELGGVKAQLVDGRELHGFLESSQQFGNWITNRIRDYGFIENQDFLLHKFMTQSHEEGFTKKNVKPSGEQGEEVFNKIIKNPQGGRPTIDYHLSLDMAKELSMVERNDKGKQARRYFIECERRLHRIEPESVPASSMFDAAEILPPFQRLQPSLLTKLGKMSNHLAQAYLVEAGVTPDYVQGLLAGVGIVKGELPNLGNDSVLRFYEQWMAGELDGIPIMPAPSEDIYTLYRHWCGRQDINPAPINRLVDGLSRRPGMRKERKRFFDGSHKSNQKAFLFPPGYTAMEYGTNEPVWLGNCVQDFRAALARFVDD